MNKITFLKFIINCQNNKEKGLSLTELLVALVISGIVLTAAASGFANLFSANQNVESKNVRSAGLQKALTYMQNDLKSAVTITAVKESDDANCNTSTNVNADSQFCLRATYPDTDGDVSTIEYRYYTFDDISGDSTAIFIKPGVLRRKRIQEDGTDSGWTAVADGLISVKETQPTVSCDDGDVNWDMTNWDTTVYGANSAGEGGFRFCINENPTTGEGRLVRIFLYGHIIGGDDNNMISTNVITFARSN